MQGILEGLLFIGGDEGVTIDKVKEVLEIDDEKLNYLINNLKESYESADRGICLEQAGDTLKLVTKLEYKDYYKKMVDIDSDLLSTAALETLAIIAYNQPMVRSQVDEVRGVDSSYNIRRLVLKGLIEEKGRSELPGRPILYGTTDKFLSHFGLSNLSELPKIEEEEVVDEDVDLFESKYQEN
jgi:segregation and condensation protein B